MRHKTTAILGALALAALSGCAHEDGLGDSVRHMTEQQVYDRDAYFNPDPAPALGGDADRLNATLEMHRNGISDPAEHRGAPLPGVSSGNR